MKVLKLTCSVALAVALAASGGCSGGDPMDDELHMEERTSAVTYAEVQFVEAVARAAFGCAAGQARNNLEQALNQACGGGQCTKKQVCQYLNLGSVMPMDCSGLPDVPYSQEEIQAMAFERFLMNLPDPPSCVDWKRNHMPPPGTLIIVPPGTPPDPWESQCMQDLAAQRAHYTGLRQEVLAQLGFAPGSGELAWSSAGPISGMHCLQILEAADPHTWADNFLCSTADEGFRWSSAGPIAGMRCTQILEAADPDTWDDNYLCVPEDSRFHFSWGSAGPGAGRCVQFFEPADPHTWQDNYLCY